MAVFADVESKMKLSPPWITYQRKLEALFEKDKDIEVGQIYETEDGYDLWIYVHTEKKHEALKHLLPSYLDFGNVKVKITLKCNAEDETFDVVQTVKDLFEGNERVFDIKEIKDFAQAQHLFVRFKPEVVQFFNDDTSDLNGNWSGLAQDIARDVLDIGLCGVHFTTAPVEEPKVEENVGKPLGEWP